MVQNVKASLTTSIISLKICICNNPNFALSPRVSGLNKPEDLFWDISGPTFDGIWYFFNALIHYSFWGEFSPLPTFLLGPKGLTLMKLWIFLERSVSRINWTNLMLIFSWFLAKSVLNTDFTFICFYVTSCLWLDTSLHFASMVTLQTGDENGDLDWGWSPVVPTKMKWISSGTFSV